MFFCLPVLTQSQTQEVQSVNGWKYGPSAELTDFSKTKSFFFTDHNSQVFVNYGSTKYPAYWNFQVTWYKDFSGPFTTPDTIYLDCKFLSGLSGIKEINVYIAVQNSNKYYFIGTQHILPSNFVWKALSWDMKMVKDFGLNSFTRFYIAFQIVTQDSCYVGADIVVDNLRGYYNDSLKTIVYDTFGDITKVTDENRIPEGFVLEQNYPNPFNPTTKIKYSISTSSQVSVKVYDLLGREIEELVNEYKIAGNYEVQFNASSFPSGVYLYKLQSGSFIQTKKMLFLK
ncbi:MAG: T9SS type A sorting domain-containing protein [Ignavibacteriales bacterium]|nr:T9SS type A sorting domain-containing protein [Ignavibacteriales bacterium]